MIIFTNTVQVINNNNVLVLALHSWNMCPYTLALFVTHKNCELQTGRVLPTHAALIYARWIIAVLSFIFCCLSPLNNLPGGRKPYAAERCQVVTVTTPADVKKSGCCSRKRNDSNRAAAYKDSNPVVGALNEPPLAGPKETTKIRAPCPEEFVSHASYLTYMWLLPYVALAMIRVMLATLRHCTRYYK